MFDRSELTIFLSLVGFLLAVFLTLIYTHHAEKVECIKAGASWVGGNCLAKGQP
jgi:hypothetical protein